MEEKAIRGVPWTLFTYAANRVVTVATTIILARLLVPGDFGLFALALLGTGFISIFSGLGVGTALILRQDLDPRRQGTVLTLLVVTGILAAAVLAGLAPLLATFFGEPRLTAVVVALAGYLSFSGVNWFYLAVLERELAFRRRFVAETTRTVVFSTCALSAAALDAGVWALVIGQAAGHIANGLVLLVLAPYRVRFGFDPSLAREMLRSGRGFVAQDGAVFLQENADYVVVGQFLGTTSLGIYSMAYRQAELPRYAIAEPLARVTFPAFSRMLHRGEDVRGAYLSALRLVAFATTPLAVIMSAAASPFVSALFGENWRAMIPVLTLLGLWGAIRPLQVTAGWYLNSTGHAGVVGRVAMSLLVPLVPALAAAAAFGNTATVALVMVAHLVVTLAILLSVAQRLERTLIRAQLRVLRPVACAGALAWLTTRLTADATTDGAAFASLTMASLVGAGTYLMVLAALDRALLGFAWHQIRRSAGRTRKAAPTA